MKRGTLIVFGIALLLVGVVSLLYATGTIGFGAVQIASMMPRTGVSGTVSANVQYYPFPLSTVVPGSTYEWSVTVSNTGTSWDEHQVIFTLVNSAGGLEDICTDWQIKWREDGTWNDMDYCIPDGGCHFMRPGLAGGQSKTYHVKMTIPSTAVGNYEFHVDLHGWIGGTNYFVGEDIDTLSTGAISGSVVLSFIGALSIIGAGVTLAVAATKPW